jgi:hypothetical protein
MRQNIGIFPNLLDEDERQAAKTPREETPGKTAEMQRF